LLQSDCHLVKAGTASQRDQKDSAKRGMTSKCYSKMLSQEKSLERAPARHTLRSEFEHTPHVSNSLEIPYLVSIQKIGDPF